MKICWDNLEDFKLTKNGNLINKKGRIYYFNNCLKCKKEYIGYKNGKYCSNNCRNKSKQYKKNISVGMKNSEKVKQYDQLLNIEYIKKSTPKILEGYQCVSDKYFDSTSKLKFKCPKGHIYKTSWSVFSYNKKGCPICRKIFSGIDKKGINRIYRNKKWLYDQYVNKLKSTKEISIFCNVDHSCIRRWLNKFDIKIRSISEGTSIGQLKYLNKSEYFLNLKKNEKFCLKCGNILDKFEFRKNKSTKDGLQSYCSACLNSYGKYNLNNDYSVYRNKVDIITNKNYRKYFYLINPNKLNRNFNEYHLDHIVSVKDGFINKIKPKIISSPVNLRMIRSKDNISKNCKSDMSIQDLIKLYDDFNTINEKEVVNE